MRGLGERNMKSRFQLQSNGSDHALLLITGNPKNCEPSHVSVRFPGGEVTIVRATDGADADYWCHFTRFRESDCTEGVERIPGKLVDARIDNENKATTECSTGDFSDPATYHVAVRIGPA